MRIAAFDLVVAALLCVAWFLGRRRGFAELAADIATIVLGGIGATVLSAPLAPLFGVVPPADRLLAWLAVYAAIALAISLAARSARKKLKEADLEDLDRRFGGILGVVEAAIGLAVMALVVAPWSMSLGAAIRASHAGGALATLARAVRPHLPERFATVFGPGIDALAPPPVTPTPITPITTPRPLPPSPAHAHPPARPAATPTPTTPETRADPPPPREPPPPPPEPPREPPPPRERADLDHDDPPEPKDPLAPK